MAALLYLSWNYLTPPAMLYFYTIQTWLKRIQKFYGYPFPADEASEAYR